MSRSPRRDERRAERSGNDGAAAAPPIVRVGELELKPVGDGTEIAIKGMPGSRRPGLRGIRDGALRVGVTQVAEKGKANVAILETLADALGIRAGRIRIVSGATSSQKRVRIEGLPPHDLAPLLERLDIDDADSNAARS